jgi:hypothetical protein
MSLFTLLGLPREGLIQVRVSRSLHFRGLLTLWSYQILQLL